jgi:hypothetical protein
MDPHQWTQLIETLHQIARETHYVFYATLACLSVMVAFVSWAFVQIKDETRAIRRAVEPPRRADDGRPF